MTQADTARLVRDAFVPWLATAYPSCVAVLEGDDNYRPTPTAQQLLIADDGGPNLKFRVIAEPLIRVTAFANGRTLARAIAADGADWIVKHRPAGISRIKNVSALLVTKDGDTGAWLASFTMPTIVKPLTA